MVASEGLEKAEPIAPRSLDRWLYKGCGVNVSSEKSSRTHLLIFKGRAESTPRRDRESPMAMVGLKPATFRSAVLKPPGHHPSPTIIGHLQKRQCTARQCICSTG